MLKYSVVMKSHGYIEARTCEGRRAAKLLRLCLFVMVLRLIKVQDTFEVGIMRVSGCRIGLILFIQS